MLPRKIHVLRRAARKKADAPDLVFVHGGYMDSRCWDIHFLPHFSALGHDCHALDLSGHGLSDGKDAPDEFGIDEFADDLRQLIAGLPDNAVLIGQEGDSASIVAPRRANVQNAQNTQTHKDTP